MGLKSPAVNFDSVAVGVSPRKERKEGEVKMKLRAAVRTREGGMEDVHRISQSAFEWGELSEEGRGAVFTRVS